MKLNEIELIINEICDYYGLKRSHILKSDQTSEVVRCRRMVVYFLRREFNFSTKDICNIFINHDSSAIRHMPSMPMKDKKKLGSTVEKEIKEISLLLNKQSTYILASMQTKVYVVYNFEKQGYSLVSFSPDGKKKFKVNNSELEIMNENT